MNTIGIDSGSSIVKIIEVDENKNILHSIMLKKIPIIQALDKFIEEEKIEIKNIEKIVLTGVGKDEVGEKIYNIPTIKVDEFIAIGTGGLYMANEEEALVVSIGTGTAFVMAREEEIKHIGGTGVGGGTLFNLCKKMANINEFCEIEEAIKNGSLKNVDLTIQDVSLHEIKTLPKDTTSANFGKLNEKANNNDIILGITNMIFETIGMMAVFATQNININNIIVVGNLADIQYINKVLEKIEKMYNVKFIIPKQAKYATAIGAIASTK